MKKDIKKVYKKYVFEYNFNKNIANKIKHKITFSEVVRVWEDYDLIVLPARSETEKRFMAIGRIHEKYWSVIYTKRKNNIRLISARRSSKNEVKIYENKTGDSEIAKKYNKRNSSEKVRFFVQ